MGSATSTCRSNDSDSESELVSEKKQTIFHKQVRIAPMMDNSQHPPAEIKTANPSSATKEGDKMEAEKPVVAMEEEKEEGRTENQFQQTEEAEVEMKVEDMDLEGMEESLVEVTTLEEISDGEFCMKTLCVVTERCLGVLHAYILFILLIKTFLLVPACTVLTRNIYFIH